MVDATWQLNGHCLEVCNCEFLCPCIPSNRTARPTAGHCITVLTFKIDKGFCGDVTLDDLGFAVALRTPGPMADGSWSVGVIIDERARTEQQETLVAIARGQAGGPMEPMLALTSEFLGVELRPIEFRKNGMKWSVSIPDLVDQEAEGVPSPVKPGEPMYLDNTGHRANPRIALAKAARNHIHAFGLDWDDDSGSNSGAFAPFNWKVS
ncbi:MAG: DUF1326 domain-containing protein [Gammaproteobacteria bacterium]